VRLIRKRREPRFWKEFRETRDAAYGITWMPKQQLREELAREQHHICCYCLARIEPTEEGMKVEHWEPQSQTDRARQIAYDNLLGACPGGQKRPQKEQHCDTHKGNSPLHTPPAREDQDCSRLFRFLSDGSIKGTTPEAEQDITTLNLNVDSLKAQRKAVLDGLRSWLEKDFPGRSARPGVLQQKVLDWGAPDSAGKLRPFCQVAIYWLTKQAHRRPSG
jgi:uncharacterized protein (TIGR02646 family)